MKNWKNVTVSDIFNEISVQCVDDVNGESGQFYDYLDDDGDVQRVSAAWSLVADTDDPEKEEYTDEEHLSLAEILYEDMRDREEAANLS